MVEVNEDRMIGWLVMAAQQWASDCAFVMPPQVAAEMVERGWMSQELKPEGSPESEEYVAASFTDLGLSIVALHAAAWGVDMTDPDQG